MGQDTTIEFGRRFVQAVEGHPLAPPTPHGRQRWVLDKLEKEGGVVVSPNTMSKWFNGTARPRGDNIRKLAQILKVDEVWLSMGRKPTGRTQATPGTERAGGATLVLAGLVQMAGGRVTFPSAEEAPVDLHVNLNGDQFAAIVTQPRETGGNCTFLVNEPAGDARIVGVVQRVEQGDCRYSAGIDLYDLSALERNSLGGFSVIELRRGKDGILCLPGGKKKVKPVAALGDLSSSS